MALKTLKKSHLDDAGAFTDQSSGKNSLRDVLEDMAKAGYQINGHTENTAETPNLVEGVFLTDGKVKDFGVRIAVTGASGASIVKMSTLALGEIASITIDNTDPNNSVKTVTVDKEVKKDDVFFIFVDTEASSATGFSASARVVAVEVEA